MLAEPPSRIAVIPLLVIIPLLGVSATASSFNLVDVLTSVGILAGMIVGGRYLLRPVLRIRHLSARSNRERLHQSPPGLWLGSWLSGGRHNNRALQP